MRKFWQKVTWALFWKRVVVRVPPMSKEKLLEAFSVDPQNPLLLGVLVVQKGMEEIAKDNIAISKQDGEERAFNAGFMACAIEAQERMMDLVERARKKK